MNYITLFDTDGKRVTSVPCDNDLTDEKKAALEANGYVEIDEDEWNYYVGNKGAGDNGTGYIRKDGKPVSAPAYVPTTPPKEVQIAQLDAQYESDKAQLMQYYFEFSITEDTEGMASIKQELADLAAQYDVALAEIEGGE